MHHLLRLRKIKITAATALSLGLCFQTAHVCADGLAIDKVYHPYVDALETEIEYRLVDIGSGASATWAEQKHQLAIGRSFAEKWFAEVYLIGEKYTGEGLDLEAFEIELKRQLTEQGEYTFDAGLLFEYENEYEEDIQELTAALLLEKEVGRWSAAFNLHLIYEWGDGIDNEFETALSMQTRLRGSRVFEPGIELYLGQDTQGIGPVIQGTFNTGPRKSLHWEAGLIFGLIDETPDQTFRFLLEYEF